MDKKIKRSLAAVAPVSRRSFFSSAGAATGGIVAASIFPNLAHANEGDSEDAGSICQAPNPIPHLSDTPFGVSIHTFGPGPVDSPLPGRDPSMITDFRGFIGEADINLTGSGTDLNTHATAHYSFHADMRFMKGVFVGTDGHQHKGTFAFI